MTQWGLDALFNPAKRHMDEEKRRLQATREQIGDSSGGKRIDLESGKVKIRRATKDSLSEDSPTEDSPTEDSPTEDAQAEDAAAEDAAAPGEAASGEAASGADESDPTA